MDSDELQPRLLGDKELCSHRLSDSESECQSNVWNTQLSPISSQPSLTQLQRPPSDLTAASLDSPDFNCQDQDQAYSPHASYTSPAASASTGSAAWAEVSEQVDEDHEGSHGTGSLKAESELLDPWDAPFDSSLPVSRCRNHAYSTVYRWSCLRTFTMAGCYTAGLQRKVQALQVFCKTS